MKNTMVTFRRFLGGLAMLLLGSLGTGYGLYALLSTISFIVTPEPSVFGYAIGSGMGALLCFLACRWAYRKFWKKS